MYIVYIFDITHTHGVLCSHFSNISSRKTHFTLPTLPALASIRVLLLQKAEKMLRKYTHKLSSIVRGTYDECYVLLLNVFFMSAHFNARP